MVLTRMENVLPAVPARDHVIKPALDLDPGFPRHTSFDAGIIIRTGKNRNIARLTPNFQGDGTGFLPGEKFP